MLRVLFCATCCGAPKPARPPGKSNRLSRVGPTTGPTPGKQQVVEEANFKSLLTLDEAAGGVIGGADNEEKSRLLSNQLQASEGYGSELNTGAITLEEQQVKTATGALLSKLTTSAAFNDDDDHRLSRKNIERLENSNFDSSEFADYSTKETNLLYDDDDVDDDVDKEQVNYAANEESDPSSIDVESFKETPGADQQTSADKSPEQQVVERKQVASSTKIGDYARLEYSPVEDLDSVTTTTNGGQSRGGSTTGGNRSPSPNQSSGGGGATSGSNQKQKAAPETPVAQRSTTTSRRSSQGIESTSISIASQLSNEQLDQQNLTNILESANSPMIAQLFGTIGLPLGPPLEGTGSTTGGSLGDAGTYNFERAETAKTSPETTGAALTSASQDSLNSLSDDQQQVVKTTITTTTTTNQQVLQSSGAALVAAEDSIELPTTTTGNQEQQVEEIPVRIESSLSMATSNSLAASTVPTPTPSEGSQKSKRKLKAKALFKKLKGGGSKKSNKTTTTTTAAK